MAVTVTTGKTHSRHCRILLDGYNLSGDARSLGAAGIMHAQAPASGWNAALDEFLNGRGALSFGPFQALFNRTAGATGPTETGAYAALNGLSIDAGTLVLGIGEAPTIGAPAFSASLEHLSAPLEVSDTAPVLITGNFNAPVAGYAGWGQILANGTSISSTTSNGSLDNGASSSGGFLAFLHVTQSAGAMGTNNWAIKIEHSTDDSAWSDLTSAFTLDGSAIDAEIVTAAGTVNRYVRATATKTAGTDLIYWLNFIRL